MSFAVAIELASMIVCLLLICGGKQKRDKGWKVLCSVLAVATLAQCASMAIVVSADFALYNTNKYVIPGQPYDFTFYVSYYADMEIWRFLQAYLYDHDERFFVGWKLDTSWVLCTVSWSVLFVSGLGVSLAAIFLPEEGSYELIPSEG